PFDGDTALVSTLPVSRNSNGNGVIARSGQYLIAPQDHVTIEDYPHAYCIRFYDSSQGYSVSYEGFFDKASGFYQPPIPKYAMVMLWGDDGSGPIAIENVDGLTGYVDRTTGETAIPFIYTGESDEVCFWNGYAMPADELTIEDADGLVVAMGMEMYLIDTSGKEVELPDGMSAVSYVFDGCLIVSMRVPDGTAMALNTDAEDDWEDGEGEWSPEDDNYIALPLHRVDPITGEKTEFDWHRIWGEEGVYYGYALVRLDGTVLYGPDPNLWKIYEPDADGMLCIVANDDESHLGHMDLSGNVIVEPRYEMYRGGAPTYYSFQNGYVVIDDLGDDWPNTERWVILDTAGTEVFTRPAEAEDGTAFRVCGDVVLENGLFWCEEASGYRLMRLIDHGAERVSDTVFEASLGCDHYEYGEGIEFSDGFHPVKQSGLWGYIDEQAQWVIPPQYDKAASFSDGLALVEKDGTLMYIDHSGAVVWEER
nr:WG repeat-containing protein [Oscillospiraceae bacterium]